MEGDFIKINEWLTPLSWLYGLGVALRNWCFDVGIIKQHSFPLPVISVGNLTVGGCGKTPHVEYLVNLLNKTEQVAVISRGYKRKSCGYILAKTNTPMPKIGDEPFQLKQKFSNIHVAVDKKRVHGIKRLLADDETSNTSVILLDDAFQHRYVKPGLNILLVDYHRLITYDKLLPAGRLREPKSGKERADIVIISKCPDYLKPIDYRVLTKAMDLRPYQKLFFTSIAYKPLRQLEGEQSRKLETISPEEDILLLSGIASPKQIITDLQPHCKNITEMTFADHHQFTNSDIVKINKKFSKMAEPKLIITTEKDATRLTNIANIPQHLKEHIYVLPIEIEFKLDMQEDFNETIQRFVSKTHKRFSTKQQTKI